MDAYYNQPREWEQQPETTPNAPETETAPQKEGFPVFGIPAMVMLTLMLIVLGMEIFYATHKVSITGRAEESVAIGLTNFQWIIQNPSFVGALTNSLAFRVLQLLAGGTLAAGLVALFYAMRNPRTVLTFACLWLIPACVPYLTMSLAIFQTATRTDSTGTLLYLFTTVLQTTSIFCFAGGLFTFLNLKKKGKAGGGPYYGLLIAVLIFLLSALTTNALTLALFGSRNKSWTIEYFALKTMSEKLQHSQAAAGNVIKLVLQAAMAVIPAVVLCLLARKKSTKGKTPLTTLWVFLAVPAGLTMMLLLGNAFTGSRESAAVFNSISAALIGGAFGGLIAYSFIHLMRRVPAVLFGLIAVALAATMSCITTQYLLMSNVGLRETVWPQVFLAAFDGRLVLIVTVLSFALRSYTEPRPWAFVVAVALLTGSMLWGEINVSYLYLSRTSNVSMLALRYMKSSSTAVSELAADRAAAVQSVRTGSQLLLAIPAVLLGAGGAVLLKYSLDAPENPERG